LQHYGADFEYRLNSKIFASRIEFRTGRSGERHEGEDPIEAAKSRAGLDDFGGDSFREGLQRLVDSINAESRLTDLAGWRRLKC
jgi:hypothetical protein